MIYILNKLLLVNNKLLIYDNYLYKIYKKYDDIPSLLYKKRKINNENALLSSLFINDNLSFDKKMYGMRFFITKKKISYNNDTFYLNKTGIFSYKNMPGKKVHKILLCIAGNYYVFTRYKSIMLRSINYNKISFQNNIEYELSKMLIYDNKELYYIYTNNNFINFMLGLLKYKSPIIIYRNKNKILFSKNTVTFFRNKIFEYVIYHKEKFTYHNKYTNITIDNYYTAYKYLNNFWFLQFIFLINSNVKITEKIFNEFINGKIYEINNMK